MAEHPLSRRVDTQELRGLSFACLEGCGFCCTFQPEASTRELALLRKRFSPRPVPVVVGEGRTFLALQNSCGACALLSARGCTAYDLRPAHCRYFPFHVYFGEAPEVNVNYTCRGVVRSAAGSLDAPFAQSVLAVAPKDDITEHERAAREAYGSFERHARRAGAWGDARAAVAEALDGPLFTGEAIEAMTRRAGEALTRDEAHADATKPFHAREVTKRPFYLAPDLQWVTFEGLTRSLVMDERGELLPRGELQGLERWADLPEAESLRPYLRALTQRRSFVGSVYAIVDDADYDTTVEEAAWWRVAELAADLVARARVLSAMGVAPADLAEETARFYDSSFLDAPTIGGWL